jgi:hypothetical protein
MKMPTLKNEKRKIRMRPMRNIAVTACAGLLAGCGGLIATMYNIDIVDAHNYDAVAEHITVERVEAQAHSIVAGPIIFSQRSLAGHSYLVRDFLFDANPAGPMTQVYVSARFEEWAQLDRAYGLGEELDMMAIDKKKQCDEEETDRCIFTETLGVQLSRSQVTTAVQKGLLLQLSGKAGAASIYVPAPYFRAVRDQSRATLTQSPVPEPVKGKTGDAMVQAG